MTKARGLILGLFVAAASLAAVSAWPVSSASAQNPTRTQSSLSPTSPRRVGGITISPAFQEIIVSDTSPAVTYNFSVTNNTSEPYELSLSAVDFGTLDESGGVLFLSQTQKSINYRYGLARYVTLERDRLVVEPKKTEKVLLTINNKESLTPGGHYGAILVTPTDSGERPTKVQINQVLSSLLFVKKQGGEIYNLSLRDYDVKTRLFTAPSAVNLRFQNSGNVHVVPRGVVTLTDPMGRLVKKGFINTGSAMVLPETFRRVAVTLDPIATAWMPGRYTASISYRYDGEADTQTRTVSFLYINGWYLIAAVLILAMLILTVVNQRLRKLAVRIIKPLVNFSGRLFRRS